MNLFITPAERTASPLEDDDNISSMSATAATSCRSGTLNSIRCYFSQVMTIVVGSVGLTLILLLPPKAVSRIVEAAFMTPTCLNIWQCVEALWEQPLKIKSPATGLVNFLRVQGRMEDSNPSMSPLDESFTAHLLPQSCGWLASRKLLPPLQHDREMLEYFDKPTNPKT